MNKLLLVVALLGISGIAYADEPAIINEPKNALGNFKDVLSTVEPSADVLLDSQDGDVKFGSSIRLYSAESLPIPVVNDLDTRLGWLSDKGAYLTLSLALDRVTGKEILKHVHIGFAGGRDFSEDSWFVGPVAGAKIAF